MKIAIIGLGGVGGYLAASFNKADCSVVGFARGKHLQAIQKNGITIVEDETKWVTPLKAMKLDDAKGHFDVVMFCVKSYDLANAYAKISKNIDENSILLSFSNGVDNANRLKNLSNSIVLDSCIYILAHIEKAGVIRKKGEVFAAVFGGNNADAVSKIENLFQTSGLRYKTPTNIKTAIWKKYIFISAFATLTSYYNTTIGAIYEQHYDEAKALLEEIATFAKENENIDIEGEVQKALDTAKKVPYDSSTSMHLDFQNGKRTELESLSGYVQKPLMLKFYKALKDHLL